MNYPSLSTPSLIDLHPSPFAIRSPLSALHYSLSAIRSPLIALRYSLSTTPYSCLIASTGSILDARNAGKKPDMMPTIKEIIKAITTIETGMAVGMT
jgi:hypothetical protein